MKFLHFYCYPKVLEQSQKLVNLKFVLVPFRFRHKHISYVPILIRNMDTKLVRRL